MDNYIFRNALNGFNRQDVTAYIEKSQKEAAERAEQLEREIEELRREKAELEKSLENSTQERETLTEQLEEQKNACEQLKETLDAVTGEKESCERALSERETQLAAARTECDGFAGRVTELEGRIESARWEKETVAQLELEARKRAEVIVQDADHRAEELLAQARAQAQALITGANEQAQKTMDDACALAEEIRADMEAQVSRTVKQYNDLFASVETVAAHISGELRKMDVSVSQLPINFNHLKEGLTGVLELVSESPVKEK